MSAAVAGGLATAAIGSGLLGGGGGDGGGGGAPSGPTKWGAVAFKSTGTGNTASKGGKIKSGAAGNVVKGLPVWLIPVAIAAAAVAVVVALIRRKKN